MGASTFVDVARRRGCADGFDEQIVGSVRSQTQRYREWRNAKEAFDHLVADDQHAHGTSYSGGIGMKHDFVHVGTVDTVEEAHRLAQKMIDDCDPRIDDKRGPAGCIAIRQGDVAFMFFGWASS